MNNVFYQIIIIALIIISAGIIRADSLSDPYQIYEKCYDAIGGLERVKADTTQYIEAKLSTYGLQGTIKIWQKHPDLNRQEIDLGVLKQIEGDNGDFAWTSDVNNKVMIQKDENALKRRELQRMFSSYDHLDPDSRVFSLTFAGIEKVDDVDCYVVQMTNTINADQTYTYFNINNFLIYQETSIQPDMKTITKYSDYREINGLLRPFRQELVELPAENITVIEFTKFESNIDIDSILFEPPLQDDRDYRFTNGHSSENIPFEYVLNHILLWVNIDGKERLWIFDTGASISVIDSSFAEELGLDIEGDIKGQGTGNTVKISFAKLPPFKLNGIEFDQQTVGSISLKKIFSKVGWEDIVGILGYDFISRFVVRVDFANKLISFYDPDSFEYPGNGVILDAPLIDGLPSVTAVIDGQYSGMWELDLGAGGTTLHFPFARENNLIEREGIDMISFGAGGGRVKRDVKFDSFEWAGYSVHEPVLSIQRDSTVGAHGKSELIGTIGNDICRHFTLYLDYNQQRLIVEKGDDYDREFPAGKSGLQVIFNDDHQLEVISVPKNTPAHEAGFKVGDVLQAINGIDIQYLRGLSAVRDLMTADAGTEYKMTVIRQDKEKILKLKLKELF